MRRVAKAVSEAQAKQAAEFAKVLDATENRFETQRQADLATVQQAADYYRETDGAIRGGQQRARVRDNENAADRLARCCARFRLGRWPTVRK